MAGVHGLLKTHRLQGYLTSGASRASVVVSVLVFLWAGECQCAETWWGVSDGGGGTALLLVGLGVCECGILISGACQTYCLTYSPLFSLVILAPSGDLAWVFPGIASGLGGQVCPASSREIGWATRDSLRLG